MGKNIGCNPGDKVVVDGPAVFTVIKKSGAGIKIVVDAPDNTTITYVQQAGSAPTSARGDFP